MLGQGHEERLPLLERLPLHEERLPLLGHLKGERDLKTLDLKVRGEGVHHHPLERAAPLRERLGNNLEG